MHIVIGIDNCLTPTMHIIIIMIMKSPSKAQVIGPSILQTFPFLGSLYCSYQQSVGAERLDRPQNIWVPYLECPLLEVTVVLLDSHN